jgi:hypothetical protein
MLLYKLSMIHAIANRHRELKVRSWELFFSSHSFFHGSISPLQIYQAIRNRGYTNEVRLRGLLGI